MKIKLSHIIGIAIIAVLIYGVIDNSLSPQFHLKRALGMNPFDSKDPLALKQVITGKEPGLATFEVPISHDLLTNIGVLALQVDGGKGDEFQGCYRATNGNCLLVWNTTFDPPGQHHLQAQLFLYRHSGSGHTLEFTGPILLFYSTNPLQFDPFYSSFDSNGALLHAKVFQTNVAYSIELRTPSGEHIKTITGRTSNGEINAHWDLTYEHGNKVTNNSFNADFHITLPDGTSETNATLISHWGKSK
jgi:hypothetical protein